MSHYSPEYGKAEAEVKRDEPAMRAAEVAVFDVYSGIELTLEATSVLRYSDEHGWIIEIQPSLIVDDELVPIEPEEWFWVYRCDGTYIAKRLPPCCL